MAKIPTSTIYTFKNVWVSVDDLKYPVASVTVILQENAIPMLRLIVDPAHKYGDPSDAMVADLQSASMWLEKLLLAAEKKTDKTEFNLEMFTSDKDGNQIKEQSLNLTGWVLNSAGLMGVSASGGFTLGLELLHPIAKLQYSGLNIGSIFGTTNITNPIAGDDIISGLVDALNVYSEAIEASDDAPPEISTFCSFSGVSADEFVETFKQNLITSGTILETHLKWDTSFTTGGYRNWPLDCLSKEAAIKNSLLSYVMSGLKDTNVWELLARNICPEWYVSITPTYWDPQLVLAPFTPWATPKIIFNSDVIADITFPSSDPNPLSGVWISYSRPGVQPDYTWFINSQTLDKAAFSGVGYMTKNPNGQIMMGGAPSWYSDAIISDAGSSGNDATWFEDNDSMKTPANISIDPIINIQTANPGSDVEDSLVRSGIAAIAEQTFLTRHRQESQIVIKCPLLITYKNSKVPGNYVIPGVSAAAKDEGGGDIVAFHIIGVAHNINCMNNSAGTEINGVYARPGTGYVDVKSPTYNPIYKI